MKGALLRLFLAMAALNQISHASTTSSKAPFVLTLTLRIAEPPETSQDIMRSDGLDNKEGRGSVIVNDTAVPNRSTYPSSEPRIDLSTMLKAVESLNETFQSLKELVDVRMVSQSVMSHPESGMVIEEVVLEGAVSRDRRSLKSVDLSPSSLGVFFLELAGSFVGLAWGAYSHWMTG